MIYGTERQQNIAIYAPCFSATPRNVKASPCSFAKEMNVPDAYVMMKELSPPAKPPMPVTVAIMFFGKKSPIAEKMFADQL